MQETQKIQCRFKRLERSFGLERSPGGGNGNPLQFHRLGNPKDRGAWWAAVRGVTRSQTWLGTAQVHG